MTENRFRVSTFSRFVTTLIVLATITAEVSAAEPLLVRSVYLRLSEDIDVPAREAGVLSEISSAEGTLVNVGDLLAKVEDHEARLVRDRSVIEVEIARRQASKTIELEIARKSVVFAETELARAERSRQAVRGAVPQSEVDRLQLELDRAQALILQTEREITIAEETAKLKEAERDLAELRLARHSIVSPLKGRVIEHYKHRGEWVEPGENLLRLVRLDVLRAEGFVDAAELTEDPTGGSVTLVVNLPGRPQTEFKGRLVFVAPEVEPTTGQVLVRAEIENPELVLRPGLSAEMSIQPATSADQSLEETSVSREQPE